MELNPTNKFKLYVNNIVPETTYQQIRSYFATFGELEKLYYTLGNRYCFIHYAHAESAALCLKKIVENNPLNVNVAYSKKDREDTPFKNDNGKNQHFQNGTKGGGWQNRKSLLPTEFNSENLPFGSCIFCDSRAYHVCSCNNWCCSRSCQMRNWDIHYKDCFPTLCFPTPKKPNGKFKNSKSYTVNRRHQEEVRKPEARLCNPKIYSLESYAANSSTSRANAFNELNLLPNSTLKMAFCYDPSHFYVHCHSYNDNINKIASKLEIPPSEINKEILKEGDLCAVQYPDKAWYRGIIMSVEEIDFVESYKIDFIDYGIKLTVEIDKIRKLPPELEQFPKMAIRCKLYGVIPMEDRWTENTISKFIHLSDGFESFTVKMQDQEGYSIHLIDKKGKNLNEILVEKRIAKISNTLNVLESFPKIEKNQEVTLIYSSNGPTFFFAHLVKNEPEYNTFLQMEEEINSLELEPLTEATEAEQVIAFSTTYNKWYRAIVMKMLSDDTFIVYFYDYGDMQIVSSIAKTKQDWLLIPTPLLVFTFSKDDELDTFLKAKLDGIVENACISSITVKLFPTSGTTCLVEGVPMCDIYSETFKSIYFDIMAEEDPSQAEPLIEKSIIIYQYRSLPISGILEENLPNIESLNSQINDYVENLDIVISDEIKMGITYLYLHKVTEDNKMTWYRGTPVKLKDKTGLYLMAIDMGFINEVHKSRVINLPEEFASIPPQCSYFSFKGLGPELKNEVISVIEALLPVEISHAVKISEINGQEVTINMPEILEKLDKRQLLAKKTFRK